MSAINPACGTRRFALPTPGESECDAPPAFYAPPAAYEPIGPGEYFPALTADLRQLLTQARFASDEAGQPRRWLTLPQLVEHQQALWDPNDRRHVQQADPAAYWLRVGFGHCRLAPDPGPEQASGLGVLRFTFDHHTTVDVVWDLLLYDAYLSRYLLLLQAPPQKYDLLAVVALPGGEQPAAALAAVAAYAQRRFQRQGLVCEALPLEAVVTLACFGRRRWMHPTLENHAQ